MEGQKEQLNLKEAAALLGIQYPTLARWCKKREDIPHVKVGKAYRFNRTALMAWWTNETSPGEPAAESALDADCLTGIKQDVERAKYFASEAARKLEDLLGA